jgi:hypothetical protein
VIDEVRGKRKTGRNALKNCEEILAVRFSTVQIPEHADNLI